MRPVVPVAARSGRVSARTHRPRRQAGRSRVAVDRAAPRPCIAATTAIAAPTPIRMSPTLKTLASGHPGRHREQVGQRAEDDAVDEAAVGVALARQPAHRRERAAG